MLERTAGFLETGSLRRLLPGSQKQLKSRRMLHSAFWHHGATDLEYSHLLAALIRGPAKFRDVQDELCSKSTINASSGSFLDFLYPSGALRLIRQYSLRKSDPQDSQRVRSGFGRLGQRLYTSAASEVSLQPIEGSINLHDVEMKEGNQAIPATYDPPSNSKDIDSKQCNSFLDTLKNSQGTQEYDMVWGQFILAGTEDRRSSISHLLGYLSTSNRSVDAERAALVFQEVRGTASYDEYESLLKLYLRLGMLQSAMELFFEGLTKFDIPVGSDILLAHTLEKGRWQTACDIWKTFRRFREEHPTLSYNIWHPSDKIQDLPDRAIQLASFVRTQLDNPSGIKQTLDSSVFVTFLTTRALLAMSDAETSEPSKFSTLLDILRHWDADIPEFYERLMRRLFRSDHGKLAVRCYRRYRQRTTKKISRPILHNVLLIASKNGSVLGMRQVLDDWIRFYSMPSRDAYKTCMSAFARQGDIETTEALFNKYLNILGGEEMIRNADDLAPLLNVHCRRGNLSEVVKIFNGIEKTYGVQPSIKCWNVLINAYGKVLDIDGAFTQFQKLLISSLQPDSYTYGTLMGICITRGDLDQAVELYQLAEGQGVTKTPAMIDCLVLGHIQDDRLLQAEKICNDALAMDFKAPLTRMWNYLLTAYAMRRDLENTNRILRQMSDTGVDYDGATYSALMQALVMVKQPDRARAILKDVIHKTGVKVTSFHYAIVMGGYIATGQLHKVFHVHNQMLQYNKKSTISTRLLMLKASVWEDQNGFDSGSQEEQWKLAKKYFYDTYIAPDGQELVDTMRRGIGYEPLDTTYTTSYFAFLIFVLGQRNEFYQATQLYEQYLESVPKLRHTDLPLKILSALMAVSLRNQDHESVQQLWDLAFEKARKQGQPFQVPELAEIHQILPLHKQALTIPLYVQMRSLIKQQKLKQLYMTIAKVENAGFVLDNKNWNTYIQSLATAKQYKAAFDLCELRLMDGWSGWARARWREPVRNRLSQELRRLRKNKNPIFLRPFHSTFLQLGKAYMDLQVEATESKTAQDILEHVDSKCRRIVYALRTMERADDDLEREILRSS